MSIACYMHTDKYVWCVCVGGGGVACQIAYVMSERPLYGNAPSIISSGLTPNSEPTCECRTFPFTGTLNDPSS